MKSETYLGDGEMVLVTGDRTMRVNVKNAVIEVETDDYVVHSDAGVSLVARYADTHYYIKAQLVSNDDGRFGTITVNETPKVVRHSGRVYTTVTDLSIISIRTAAEAVGASEDDVFEVQEEDSGEYRLTWEL